MKLRSRGLGRKELVMDFREYDIAREGDDVVVSGTIREPVNWDFTIRIAGDDIPGMLRVALHRHTLAMAARWALHARGKPSPVPAVAPVAIGTATRALKALPADPEDGADPAPEVRAAAPKEAPITQLRPPVPGGEPLARTPDFGVPRRRGWSPERAAPAAPAIAEGGGR